MTPSGSVSDATGTPGTPSLATACSTAATPPTVSACPTESAPTVAEELCRNHVKTQTVVDPAAMVELDAIDLRLPEAELVSRLMHNLRHVGFLTVSGVEGYDEGEHFEAVRAFFQDVPPAEREKMIFRHQRPGNQNYYRGVTPVVGNDPAHKEMFDMGAPLRGVSARNLRHALYEETPFPPQAEYAWIQAAFEKHYSLMSAVGLRLVECMALGLGKPRDFFHGWFSTDPLSTFRAIHNVPRSANLVDSSALSADHRKLTTPEHCDSGFLTILTTFGFPGLQAEIATEDGRAFRSVKAGYNDLVVNLGDMFERMTNFELKATKHRVLDIGVERYSSPFFFEPHYEAVIPSNILCPEKAAAEAPIVYGDWLVAKIKTAYVEWRGFSLPDTSLRYRTAGGAVVSPEPNEGDAALGPSGREVVLSGSEKVF